ncbi:MAG: hypothetical protein ACFFFH_02450 [Candidatus Thorarchaeota archaeon]
MTFQRKTWKKFMKTILSQIPPYIAKYPPSDQIILNEFLSILQDYTVDTQETRNQLLERLEGFQPKYHNSEKYLTLPFLWFVESYFSNSAKLLSVASFHADNFYEYLVKQLRGYSDTEGVFQLLRRSTPLTDLKWEELQYACNKLSVPLRSEELHALETIHTMSLETGLSALDQKQIKINIFNWVKSPPLYKKLENLFLRLDSRWFLRFYNPAFGLELLFFQFQLNESTSLQDVIDFHNSTNSTLCNSSVYWVRGFQNMYCGILVVPINSVNSLQNYLQKCHSQAKLVLHELTQIKTSHISVSLLLYQATKGWRTPTPTDWRRLVPMLKTKNPRKMRTKLTSYYLTHSFNEQYTDHLDRSSLIHLFCKIPREFSFKELPLDQNNDQTHVKLSKAELKLLEEMYERKIVQIGFLSNRLIYEFSLDIYWIKTPKVLLNQLSRLLAWIPYSRLYFTEKNIFIWAYLTSEFAHWLSTDLEWTVIPIIENHNPHRIKVDWYISEEQQWKTPHILKRENVQ